MEYDTYKSYTLTLNNVVSDGKHVSITSAPLSVEDDEDSLDLGVNENVPQR